ncbi:MAG: primosomal protein N', partial [Planctomycetales bacterium]|nr:primosomal protein N' [Planctomycetales bacterium]
MTEQQRGLFATDPWEIDDRQFGNIAVVVFAEGASGSFDYLIPDELLSQLSAGQRVKVPFGRGNSTRVGYCVEVRHQQVPHRRLKSLAELLDDRPLLSPAMLRLTQRMADYYLTDWGKVLEAVIPTGVRAQAGTRMQTQCTLTTAGVAVSVDDLPTKQAAAICCLRAAGGTLAMAELQEQVPCTAVPLRGLEKKGLLRCHAERVQVAQVPHRARTSMEPITLNDKQREAVDAVVAALQAGRHEVFLLHGVTGSGKTEVYIKAIEEMIRFRRQAIVLVPEISLTPQTQHRFRSRFPEVAVLHSHLSDSERNAHWQRIAAGEVQVIVGARSAVFAPTPHLGLIVIDEEHEASFKQDKLPRYHAREVAQWRAESESIPLILGSATPSLETWQRARTGQASLLSMPHRILDLPLPDVVIVDTRHALGERRGPGAMSSRMLQALKLALDANEQVILLLNRRGYSTHIQCPACGYVAKCPHCDIALTHHREGERAVCHYCEYLMSAPARCPDCKFEGIRYSGLGTQRLEAEVRARFPRARVLRMDSDTMRRPGSHEESLTKFRDGEVDILVGTQMIAKGLDFPNVTVVG